jgi:hypothetical protein
MALADDIEAARTDDSKSEDEKRAAIYAIKVNGIVPRIVGFVGQSWTLNDVSHRLQSVTARTVNGVLCLELVVTRTRSGWVFDPYDVLRIVNPPIGRNGKNVDGMNNAELAEYARALAESLPPGVPA